MNNLEDRLRETLAQRAALSPVDPGAWDKTVARSRRRLPRWQWLTRTGLLAPVAAAAAVVAIIVAAATLTGHTSRGPAEPGPASPSPSGPPLKAMDYLVREIPPVTPFVQVSLFAYGQQIRDYLWFGYVPEHAAAGILLCQYNDGGGYDGYSGCTSGSMAAGQQARLTATDGTAWIRLGVTSRRVTSVTALLHNGQTVRGVVKQVPGVPYRVWAVSYPVQPAASLVFRDAAGHEVTRLDVPGEQPAPSRPSHGGIPLFRYGGAMMTAYRISGDRIGFWWGASSMWSDTPVSDSPLRALETGATRSSTGSTPDYWFGYAPAGTARVTLRLADGRQFTASTRPGWPGSGLVFWGPLTLPTQFAMPFDMIVITYDATGRVLREVPYILAD